MSTVQALACSARMVRTSSIRARPQQRVVTQALSASGKPAEYLGRNCVRTCRKRLLQQLGKCDSALVARHGQKAALRKQERYALRANCSAIDDEQANRPGVKEAAKHVVDSYVRSGMTIGMGLSGPACRAAMLYIAQQISEGRLKDIRCVAMSNTAATEAAFHGIKIVSLEATPVLDFAFDYVDQVDEMEGTLPAIKGRSAAPVQPNLFREAAVIKAAKIFVAFANEDAVVDRLGGCLPVYINGDYWESIAEELDDIFIGEASIWRRPTSGEAPPHGGDNPYIGSENESYLDLIWENPIPAEIFSYEDIDQEISEVPGIYAHGLFRDSVYAVAVAGKDEYRILSPGFSVNEPITKNAGQDK